MKAVFLTLIFSICFGDLVWRLIMWRSLSAHVFLSLSLFLVLSSQPSFIFHLTWGTFFSYCRTGAKSHGHLFLPYTRVLWVFAFTSVSTFSSLSHRTRPLLLRLSVSSCNRFVGRVGLDSKHELSIHLDDKPPCPPTHNFIFLILPF